MASLTSSIALIGAIALAGAVTPVRAADAVNTNASIEAQADSLEEVKVMATRPVCEGVTPEEARRLAREAQKNDDHALAAACFTAAGDTARAHRELVRDAADRGEAARENAEAGAKIAKTQFKRLQEAFR